MNSLIELFLNYLIFVLKNNFKIDALKLELLEFFKDAIDKEQK